MNPTASSTTDSGVDSSPPYRPRPDVENGTSPGVGARRVEVSLPRPQLQSVFIEHANRVTKAGVRAVVHCIAVPTQGGVDRLAASVRSSLQEWVATERRASAASAEPRLLSTAGKGLRGCIPPGFGYLHVGWRGGGVVCPLDEAVDGLPVSFGMDVMCSLAGWMPSRVLAGERKAVQEHKYGGSLTDARFEILKSRVTALAQAWHAAK